VTGACVSAGLMLWFAPRVAAELRDRAGDSARTLNQRATEEYRQARATVVGAAESLATSAQAMRETVSGTVADAVAQSAHEIERRCCSTRTRLSRRPRSTPSPSASRCWAV
jgi:gas vesicle protein